MRLGGTLKVTLGCINSVASRMEITAHCTNYSTSGKETCVLDEMAEIQMRSCKYHFVSVSPLLSSFRWASTDTPWNDLDDDGVEVPSDDGEWVSVAFQFSNRPSC
jgi:hypothetical protein